MTTVLTLQQIFHDDQRFAWKILQAQCAIHSQTRLDFTHISSLTELYVKAVQKLNALKDPREKYFTIRMTKLMAEPQVIKCFNTKSDTKKGLRENRKIELEQQLAQESEKSSYRKVEHMIQQHKDKEKQISEKIDHIFEQHEKSLKQRLEARALKKSADGSQKKAITSDYSDSNRKSIQWTPSPKQKSRKFCSEVFSLEFK